MSKQKYKPCCGRRCLLNKCKTREAAGCSCLCSLKDHENSYLQLLEGTMYRSGAGLIYEPGRKPTPLEGEEKEETLLQLEEIRRRIKQYEIA